MLGLETEKQHMIKKSLIVAGTMLFAASAFAPGSIARVVRQRTRPADAEQR
jgi:hypothetical protein